MLALGLGLALCVVVLTRGAGPPASAPVPDPRVEATAPARPASQPTMAEPPSRNPFEYAEEGVHRPRSLPAPSVTLPQLSAPAPPEPASQVRLVGLVRQGGALKAALALSGDIVVVGEGESVEGYTVLSLEEESGVRLRAPDGAEIALPLPPS